MLLCKRKQVSLLQVFLPDFASYLVGKEIVAQPTQTFFLKNKAKPSLAPTKNTYRTIVGENTGGKKRTFFWRGKGVRRRGSFTFAGTGKGNGYTRWKSIKTSNVLKVVIKDHNKNWVAFNLLHWIKIRKTPININEKE